MPRLAALALVAASILWGTTGTAAHFMPANVSPLAIGAATMGIGGLLLFLFSARGSVRVLAQRTTRKWALLGAIGVFIYPLAFYSAMHLAGVAVGNVVALGSGPVFAALIEWIIDRRRPTRRWVICTALAVVGIALLAVLGHSAGAVAGNAAVGVLVGLLAGLAYALYTYCSTRVLSTGVAGRAAMGAMFGAGAVLLAPVLLITGAPLLQSPRTVGIAAYLVVAPMFLAYLLFAAGLRTIRSSVATTITLIEPVVATVLAVLVVGERLTAFGWLGIALILGGVAILATARLPGERA